MLCIILMFFFRGGFFFYFSSRCSTAIWQRATTIFSIDSMKEMKYREKKNNNTLEIQFPHGISKVEYRRQKRALFMGYLYILWVLTPALKHFKTITFQHFIATCTRMSHSNFTYPWQLLSLYVWCGFKLSLLFRFTLICFCICICVFYVPISTSIH